MKYYHGNNIQLMTERQTKDIKRETTSGWQQLGGGHRGKGQGTPDPHALDKLGPSGGRGKHE